MSRVWSSIRSFLRAGARRLFAKETLLCALALSPGSLFVMMKLPVLWRDFDGLGQITAPPGHLTILAQPHLYPVLSRLPVLFVSALSWLVHPHSLELNISRPIFLNDAGLILLVAAQHLALLFALALLVVICSRRPLVRCLIVIVLLGHPVLFVVVQFVSSEALATILAIVLIAIAVSLSRQNALTPNGVIALGLCLYAAMMTRHNAVVYAVLVPLIFLFGTIASVRNQTQRRAHFRKFLITSSVGVAALIAARLTAVALCLVLHEPYRSVVGRTAIYRFDLIDRMPAQEKDDYLRKLQAAAPDPITKEAIPAVLAAKGYWGNSMRVIKDLIQLQDKTLRGKKLDARADHYLNEICRLYYQAPPAVVFTEIREGIVESLIRTTPKEVVQFFYKNAADSLTLYRSNPDLRKKTAHLESCSPDAESRIQRAKETWWLRGFDPIPCGITFLIIATVAIVLRSLGRFEENALRLLVALGAVNVLMIVVTLSLTPYLPRFVLPSCVVNVGALAILLGDSYRRVCRSFRQRNKGVAGAGFEPATFRL
jgi:hypothetical protein